MNKKLTLSGVMTLMLGLVTFLWLLFHMYQLRADVLGMLQISHTEFDYISIAGYHAMLLFHASAFLFMFMYARYLKRFSAWWILALGFGIVSLFAIAVEKVMYDEIVREMIMEFEFPGEISILYICLGINLLFSIIMMAAVFHSLPLVSATGNTPMPKDERIFNMMHVMGIVSGVTGLLLTYSLIEGRRPVEQFWVFIPFYLLFLAPYGVAALYWLTMKWRERMADWYDEKQVRDTMKASLTTLLLSVPGLAMLALIQRSLEFYWFPFYLFMILSLFSVSTLYYFKRE